MGLTMKKENLPMGEAPNRKIKVIREQVQISCMLKFRLHTGGGNNGVALPQHGLACFLVSFCCYDKMP